MWSEDERGGFVTRHFAERRDRVRSLVEQIHDQSPSTAPALPAPLPKPEVNLALASAHRWRLAGLVAIGALVSLVLALVAHAVASRGGRPAEPSAPVGAAAIDAGPGPQASALTVAEPDEPTVPDPAQPAEVALPPEPDEPDEGAKATGPEPPTGPKQARPAWLTVDSRPWARIVLDGKEIGVTPISRLRTRAGPRSLEATRSDGLRQRLTVRCVAGRESKVLLQWP